MNPNKIFELGEQICNCLEHCAGVKRDPTEGDFPRGLYLETENTDDSPGTVICGLNPGSALIKEKEYYLSREKICYLDFAEYWKQKIRNLKYFEQSRKLVQGLERKGPILWTDLVKCENESDKVELSFRYHSATFRRCTQKFLFREIKWAPKSWLIVALGWEAYRALMFMFPERQILGVPHPSGSRGLFSPFFENGCLKIGFRNQILDFFKDNPKGTIWINPKSQKSQPIIPQSS